MRWCALLVALFFCAHEGPQEWSELDDELPDAAPKPPAVEGYRVASSPDDVGPFTNRLAVATSPYLLQHAHNPVDWFPWGDEAFAQAERRDVPIFLSIGYAACHWCHVMEEESFTDPEIAAYMNAHFVNIKVDREERPAVDGVYMKTLHAMRGRGGWPASLFLDHERRPFYAGTYFPKETELNRTGFREILHQMNDRWNHDRTGAEADATNTLNALRRNAFIAPSDEIDWDAPKKAIAWLDRSWDHENAGWGSKKFPMLARAEFLLAYAVEHDDDHAASRVRQLLDAMDHGGIHDHIGGGMHRYTVDKAWAIPHFEKMLYDNGQFVRIYSEAAVALGEPRYGDVARDIADYLIREMQHPEGAFFSSQDAGSAGEEGTYYVWTPEQIRRALPAKQAKAFRHAYRVTDRGNFEGRTTVLTRAVTADPGDPSLVAARSALRVVRDARVRPPTDTKRVVAYNGLAISGLARAGRLLNEPRYTQAAGSAARAVLAARRPDGSLPRTLEPGAPLGVIDDYAWLAEGLLDLYEADPDPAWLIRADEIATAMTLRFWDSGFGGFYYSEQAEELLFRQKEYADGARPSGAGRAIVVLQRLRAYGAPSGDSEKIQRALQSAVRYIGRSPGSVPSLIHVVDSFAQPRMQVVIVTPQGQLRSADPFIAEYNRAYRPHDVLAVVDIGEASLQRFGTLSGKLPAQDHTQAFVCFDGLCKQPTADLGEFATLIR